MLLASLTSGILPAGLGAVKSAAAALARGADSLANSFAPSAPSPSSSAPPSVPDDPPTASFKDALLKRLKAAGLAASSPLELSPDGIGGIAVKTDSPERFDIEQWLNQQPDLVAQFQQLASASKSDRFSVSVSPQRFDALM